MTVASKTCTRCRSNKPTHDFSRDSSTPDGLSRQCRPCRSEMKKASYEVNREAVCQRVRVHRADNADRINSAVRERRMASQKYRQEQASRRAAWGKANRVNLRPAKRVASALRRARQRQAKGRFTTADIATLLRLQRRCCAVCHRAIGDQFHVDHKVPLARGGSNDFMNIQILCETCNCTKGARDPVEFMQSRGFLL